MNAATTDYSLERGLPASVDAERSILGGILQDNAAIREASAANLLPEDFSFDSHRRIFARIRELASSDRTADLITVAEELARNKEIEAVGGVAYLASLTDGMPRWPSIQQYIRIVKDKALLRGVIFAANGLIARAMDTGERGADVLSAAEASIRNLADGRLFDVGRIRAFAEIPDIFEADITPPSYIVPDLVPLGAHILMAGEPGIGKSYLALRLAIACAMGARFLERDCAKTPALYLDRENPGSIVRERIERVAGGPVPELKVWGGWLKDAVPNLDDPRLIAIAKEQKPVIVVDSLIRFHDGEENSATDMSKVLGKLRALADAGATVLTIHHRGKGENAADYRGSSDIGGGPDIVCSLTRDAEGGLLTLKQTKNRFGAELKLTIRPDYEVGTFEVTEAPAAAERREQEAELAAIISTEPGINTRGILGKAKDAGIPKCDVLRLLRVGTGQWWRAEDGPQRSRLYYPLQCSAAQDVEYSTRNTSRQKAQNSVCV